MYDYGDTRMAPTSEQASGISLPKTPMVEAGPARLRATLLFPLSLVASGFAVRLALAHWTFLNPDEAWHYLLSVQPSFGLAYKASLTTAHPPLLIVLLYWWHRLGDSELILRIPSVVAGTMFCFMTFLWVEKVSNRVAALFTLTLLLFLPSQISISAEIRQYSFLLLFSGCSLYFLECALAHNSVRMLLFSFLTAYLALLTHYSSLIFVLTTGIYALLRLPTKRARLIATWVTGQLGVLALTAFLVTSHISVLRKSGLPQQIANTWLSNSIFHPGQNRVGTFALKATVRLFRYFFSHGTIGVLGLLLFLGAIALLFFSRETAKDVHKPSSRQLAILLVLPFVINLAAGLAGLYPYGGTRHSSLLAGFAMTGISIAVAGLKISRAWLKPLILAVVLATCNLFPFRTPPYISPRYQRRELMVEALNYLRQAAPASVLVTDYEGGLLLSYYLCFNKVVDLGPISREFMRSRCGDYQVLTPPPTFFIFDPKTLPEAMGNFQARYDLPPDMPVWLFQAGWINYRENLCREFGGKVGQNFGKNILLCQINAGAGNPKVHQLSSSVTAKQH
jgi:hypothetical protein